MTRFVAPRDGDYWLIVEGGRAPAVPVNVRVSGVEMNLTLPECADPCVRVVSTPFMLKEGDEVEVRLRGFVVVVPGRRNQRRSWNGLQPLG